MLTLKDFIYNYYQLKRNLTDFEPLRLYTYATEDMLNKQFFNCGTKSIYEIDPLYVDVYQETYGNWDDFKAEVKSRLECIDGILFDVNGDYIREDELPKCNYEIVE